MFKELITQRKNISEVKFAAQDIVDEFIDETLKGDWPFKSETDIPFIRKFFIQDEIITKSTPRQKLDAGQVVHYISTAALDRDHEIMKPSGAELRHYRKNPMVLWSHDPRDPDNIVGKNIWINMDQKGLVALTQFALAQEKAAKVYNLYRDGFLRAWSVGFTPLKGKVPKKDEKFTFIMGEPPKPGEVRYVHEKWALLEYSAVGVPSNPEALTEQVAKGYELTDELVKELEINLEGIYVEKKDKTIIDLGSILGGKSKEEGKEGEEEEAGKEGKTTKQPKTVKRWNASLSKLFDVEAVESHPSTFEYALLEKFLECKVSKIFKHDHFIPSPLMANFLAGFKAVLSEFKLKDTRNFLYDGRECPPGYETMQLNSKESDDFLVSGMAFYDVKGIPLAVKYESDWFGLYVSFVTSTNQREWNKSLMTKAVEHAKKHNKLKGEKFALNGEFLDESDDAWDNLIIDPKSKDSISKSIKQLEKRRDKSPSRGLLFVGRPGTGKTKTGRVIINEVDSTFIWVSSRDFRRVEPTRALSLAFEMARDLAPSVLFIEDIDTWLHGVAVDLLKTELDGVRQNTGMITILTSNFPEKLPDALLDRPGRFHHVIDFVLPGKIERREMIEKWAGNIGDETMTDLIEKTDGFSGSHMKELVDFAKMIVDEDEIELGEALLRSLERLMEQRELIEQIRESKEDKGIEMFMSKFKRGSFEAARVVLKEDDFAINQNFAIMEDMIKDIQSEFSELKAGREISGKNMKMLTEVADSMEKATTAVRVLLEANTSEEDKCGGCNSVDVDSLLKDVDVDKKGETVLTKKDQLDILKDLKLEDLAKSVMEKRKGKVS